MRFKRRTIKIAVGKDGGPWEKVQDEEVDASCSRGLAYHPHRKIEGRWTVTHIASGYKIDPDEGGFQTADDARAYVVFAVNFGINWKKDDLLAQTSAEGPGGGTPLAEFGAKAALWGLEPEDRPENDDPADNPIMNLFGK